MWAGFSKKGTKRKSGRLKTVLSTMPGKHGDERSHTEVPRETLLAALATQSELHSTHTLAERVLCEQIDISL
jgi:hypothetical protein